MRHESGAGGGYQSAPSLSDHFLQVGPKQRFHRTGVDVAQDDDGFSVVAGEELRIPMSTLLANDADADGDALSITAVNGATIDGNDIVFTSATAGNASFTYMVSDGKGGTDTATVDVVVTPAGGGENKISLDDLTVFIVDAQTDQNIVELTDGAEIGLSVIENRSELTIVVTVDDPADADLVESIRFVLNDGENRIDHDDPYALFGDKDKGKNIDYYGEQDIFQVGLNTLDLGLYSDNKGRDPIIEDLSLAVTFVDDL